MIALADILIVPWFKHELPNALIVGALVLALAGIAADLAAGTQRVAVGAIAPARKCARFRRMVRLRRRSPVPRLLRRDHLAAHAVHRAGAAGVCVPARAHLGRCSRLHGAHRVAWQELPAASAACRAHHSSRGGYLGTGDEPDRDLGRRRGGLARPGVAALGQDRPRRRGARMADALLRRRHDVLVRGDARQLVGLRRACLDTIHAGGAHRSFRRGASLGWSELLAAVPRSAATT